MDKQEIKRVIGRLKPDDAMEDRLAEKLTKGDPGRASYRAIASIAAGLVMIIGTGVLIYSHSAADANLRISQKVSQESTIAQGPDGPTGKSEPETQDHRTQDHSTGVMEKERTNTDREKEENALKSENSPVEDSSPPGSEAPRALPPKSDENADTGPVRRSDSADSSEALLSPSTKEQNTGIFIPQIQLPGDTEPVAKMMGLIVYQGRIYKQSSSSEEWNNAAELVGEKLGTTKGNLTEWSTQRDDAPELASTVGVRDVYTVKGYEKSFRIMTYDKLNGQTYAYFFECLNGMTVKTGNDVFGKFNIENNIGSLKYEDFDSWDSGKNHYKAFTGFDQFARFLEALENAIPLERESLSYLFDEQGFTSQKFMQVKLKDGTEVELRLIEGGYVYYNGLNIVFKVEDAAFRGLWNELN
ncbi:hypothetical protein Sgly_0892 [Syntrophobotulus glycolicus DSM 8271]|uniref:Uncharacterized protein n=1 Tax=Syntrophobotulus glycolicus (strain DSM 8271 / FlGlyR) TaxID=645991 RepID=F0T1X4_SYNGF|nr:hypothetical protein [Syntrophobotulus glycolicus]ADY55238.1 hypothetical protein Sgly_0892 [Syntrophobotulus glycolicus DSM 8271]